MFFYLWKTETKLVIVTRRNIQENELDAFENVWRNDLITTTSSHPWLKTITRVRFWKLAEKKS